MLTPSTCSGSPASSFPGSQKAGLGMRRRIHLGAQVNRVIKTRTFLRGLDEVFQLLHGVGHLLYEDL